MRTTTLSRQRLLDQLSSATQNRITLVTAEGGYGKTTLLADFSRRLQGACLWYSLESSDSDWITIVHHLVAAGREVLNGFGESTLALLRTEPGMNPPRAAVLSSLSHEMQAFAGERAVLILDDVHLVDDSEDAREVFLQLIRDAPRSFSFVLAGRRRPGLTVARWGGMGEVTQFTTDDLRFSQDETARLFEDSYGRPLEDDVLHELDSRTRGWVACLQLFSTLIHGYSPTAVRSAVVSLSGATEPIYEYLAQEVMARLPPELRTFVTRAALLNEVVPDHLPPLFPEHSPDAVERWAAEAEGLGMLNRTSQTNATRHFHPLLRDFLLREAGRRYGKEELSAMHAAVARGTARSDPLVACHHFIEAGQPEDAMRCLDQSTLETMGSARWGTAAQLANRLSTLPPTGAVAAIQARRLLEDGDLDGAAAILSSVPMADQDATVRAVLRHTMLSLGWRRGDGEALMRTLQEILGDPETPEMMRDIARIFHDSSPHADRRVTLSELSDRLRRMAERQDVAGFPYYAAISLHNAGICAIHAGRKQDSASLLERALLQFHRLMIRPPDYYSAHAQLGSIYLELGKQQLAEQHISESLSSSNAHGDVYAETAYQLAVVGDRSRAARLLRTAEDLEYAGRSDLAAQVAAKLARSLLHLPTDPDAALEELEELPAEFPLDLGYHGRRYILRSLAYLLSDDRPRALATARAGREAAQQRGNRASEAAASILLALAGENAADLETALSDADDVCALAILEVADGIGHLLDLVSSVPPALETSIERWPGRWLPVLRRQLERGDDPRARVAARLLDRYGAVEDVVKLRAFAKTYRQRGVPADLGRSLVRRVSPHLRIHDLGHVSFSVDGRVVPIGRTRRKPAGLLMYLVSRPNFSATREQVIEDLWPEPETNAGVNSLNQSLYFIRREINPWYEDGISPEYITYEAELVSLDPDLVEVDSAAFVTRSRQLAASAFTIEEASVIIDSYGGQFAPEFEYEDWAIAWRTRVHGVYLDFSRTAILNASAKGDLRAACDTALRILAVDPAAQDVERSLIWLYWHLGARSAAEAHHAHLAGRERADGFEATTLEEIVSARRPN